MKTQHLLISTAAFGLVAGTTAFTVPSAPSTMPQHRVLQTRSLMATPKSSNPDGKEGKLELLRLKERETELRAMLAAVQKEKTAEIQSRPLRIGVVGFGRFGQFISKTFQKYGQVVATSRGDYSEEAQEMGVDFVPESDFGAFVEKDLDVIVMATSIMSFESTVRKMVPHIERDLDRRRNNGDGAKGPLIVDVLSVKEHARNIMLQILPDECDLLCTHPMFGPDSGKNGWNGLNFVYEKTRVDSVLLDTLNAADQHSTLPQGCLDFDEEKYVFTGCESIRPASTRDDETPAHVEGMDRVERFLSIFEEEGCNMVNLSCKKHDEHAANSQFLTHLIGRTLGEQGLSPTPIDTKGFESVLKLVDSTTADSFDLFYGLYKFNQNSMDTIMRMRAAMDNVIHKLHEKEREELEKILRPSFDTAVTKDPVRAVTNGAKQMEKVELKA